LVQKEIMEVVAMNIGDYAVIKGVYGKIVGVKGVGGILVFSTPHGSIIEGGALHFSPVNSQDIELIKRYEEQAKEAGYSYYKPQMEVDNSEYKIETSRLYNGILNLTNL
jgi:hypothetical protein